MALFVVVSGTIGLGVGLYQLWSGLKATRVQRSIDLHRDLTTGEIGRAADRLSTMLWKEGERRFGRNRCYAPQWHELLTAVRGGADAGELGTYLESDRLVDAATAEPLRDLYAILWCFERIEAGRAANALDRKMTKVLVGPHAAWWSVALRHVSESDTSHIASLNAFVDGMSPSPSLAIAAADFKLLDTGRPPLA